MSKAINVFGYLNYRRYLAEVYRQKKAESRAFSYRAFARRAGLSAPNHLKRVIDGERNLSDETAQAYASALELRGDAEGYFLELVRFTQAKSDRQKSESYDRLNRFRGYRRAQRLDANAGMYHSEWYIPAIRELASRPDFRADPKWLAGMLLPPIRETQAAAALRVLSELGMLTIEEDGRATPADQVVSTGPETGSVHVRNYHRSMLQKATESLDAVHPDERDLSAVTLCLPRGALPQLKERVREFRRDVIAMEAPPGLGDQVVHVAIQVFPLSQATK